MTEPLRVLKKELREWKYVLKTIKDGYREPSKIRYIGKYEKIIKQFEQAIETLSKK